LKAKKYLLGSAFTYCTSTLVMLPPGATQSSAFVYVDCVTNESAN
jgi:hypothetical protein